MLAKKTNDQPLSPVRRPTLQVFPQLYICEANVAGSEHVQSAFGKRKPSRVDGFAQVRPLLLQAVIFAVDLEDKSVKAGVHCLEPLAYLGKLHLGFHQRLLHIRNLFFQSSVFVLHLYIPLHDTIHFLL